MKSIIDNRGLVREILLYGFIGGFSALSDSIAFYFLSKHLNKYFGNIISINIGITISFFLNTYFNFGVKDNLLKRCIRFFTIGYTGLLISMIILFIGVDLKKIEEMPVKILSVFIVAAFQFILNKLITFKETI